MRLSRWQGAVALILVGALGAARLLILTAPSPLDESDLPVHTPDPARGEVLFHAGSCGSCHKAAKGEPGADRGLPTGSGAFQTPIGTFHPGNLTPDPETGDVICSLKTLFSSLIVLISVTVTTKFAI